MSILQDLRHAVRLLRREPGYAAIAVLAIALGIGATTTLFSVTYGVLLKPLPWPEPQRLVRLEERRGGRTGRIPWTITNGTYLAWHDSSLVDAIGGWMSLSSTFSDAGEPERIRLGRLTPTVFTVLDARALIGRVFDARDAANHRVDTVILSHGFWQRRFGGAADVVGRSVRLDYLPYTVVGVMPPAFVFPDRETQAWIPSHVPQVYSDDGKSISLQIFGAIARMRPDVTAAQVAAEGTARARAARDPGTTALALFGSGDPPTITATPALDVVIAEVRPAIRILLAAVLLLFGTAVASVATVQLARVAKRRREMTVRAALGASTSRLARQWLTESAVTGVAGGVLGIAGARLLIALLPAILPADFPRVSDITLDWRVALASTLATLAAIAVCALVPTLQARRIDLVQSLADDHLAPVGGGVRTAAARLRAVIMAGQIAVACVLLIGAVPARPQLAVAHQRRSRIRSGQSPDGTAAAAPWFHLREERRNAAGHRGSGAGASRRHARVVWQRIAARFRRWDERIQRPTAARSLDGGKSAGLPSNRGPWVLHDNGVAAARRAALDRQRHRDIATRARGEQVVRRSVSW